MLIPVELNVNALSKCVTDILCVSVSATAIIVCEDASMHVTISQTTNSYTCTYDSINSLLFEFVNINSVFRENIRFALSPNTLNSLFQYFSSFMS